MQWCTANAFPCCLPATTIQQHVSLSGQQPIRLVYLFVSCDTVAFTPLCPWQTLVVVVFVGTCPVRFLLVVLLDGEAHIWLGDLRFVLCGLCLLFCFVLLICLPT